MSSPAPPWSPFSVGPRGKSAYLSLDIADVLTKQFQIAAARKKTRSRGDDDPSDASVDDSSSDSDCDSADTDSDHSNASEVESSDSESICSDASMGSDSEYIPSRPIFVSASDHILRPRGVTVSSMPPASLPTSTQMLEIHDVDMPATDEPNRALAIALHPFPDEFTRAHLALLDFAFVQRDDETAVFVDEKHRIGAAYIGGPEEGLEWQRTVIQAGNDMLEALECLRIQGVLPPLISAGIRCHGLSGTRPQNISVHSVTMVHIALAGLRDSVAIRSIAYFQNSVFRKIAPRAWAAAHADIERVLDNDLRLRLPFDTPNERHLPVDAPAILRRQPTAFSHVEYCFVTDGVPRRETRAQAVGMSAITALGDYSGVEGELILWEDERVVNFLPGSTFLLPNWMHYSFTPVEAPGHQMILMQSCDNALSEFVANGCSSLDYDEGDESEPELLTQQANAAAARYSTREEYDIEYNSGA
ncbi:hypothetical protein C8R46DRAFT_1050806 [Mycena filopes]|nr:hypothetical protein C8R46DRAFT_1050806 [Mycena filopes]